MVKNGGGKLLVVMLMSSAAPALAQTTGDAEQNADTARVGIDDIVVTAQKRAQSSQDVGITLSVESSDDLARRNVLSISDAVVAVPQVQVNQTSDLISFNFRGIGMNEFTANLDPPIAVNIDEIYQSKTFMTGLSLFDVERVEVLKGPQGTLYGRNATGGAANFFTKKPEAAFHAGGTIGYGNYDTLRGEAFVNVPLGDTLSARLSGMFVEQGKGFYKNVNIGGSDGRQRRWAARGQIRWNTGGTDAILSAHYGKDRSIGLPDEGTGIFTPASFAAGAPVFCADYVSGDYQAANVNCVRGTDGGRPGDRDPFTTSNDQRARVDVETAGASLRVSHDLGWGTINSISAYEWAKRNWREDSDGTPIPTVDANYDNSIKQFTQELRLNGKSGHWNYVLGAFYEHDKFRNNDYIVVGAGAGVGLYSPFIQKTDAFALFFHNDIGVTDNLSLIAGLRYSNEKVTIDGGTFAGTGVVPPGVPTTILVQLADSALTVDGGSHRDTSTTFKVGVEWRPSVSSPSIDNLLFYGHVSTGFRSGGYNAEFLGSQAEFTSLAPEKITAYEAGFKSTLNRNLTFNGSVFYYDFADAFVRVDSPTTIVSVTINAGTVRSYGAEFDVNWQPFSGLRLGVNGGYLSSTIQSDLTIRGQSIKGNSTVNSPKWTFGLDGSYEVPVGDRVALFVGADANYRSAQFLETSNHPSTREAAYWIVGAQAGLKLDDRFKLTGWVKNLLDKEYRIYAHDLPGFGFLINLYGQPRTYGLSLAVNF